MKILYGRSALVRGALAGAVAVGLGVSGCSKNIEPEAGKTPTATASKSATPTPSETPTPTPTPTPTAPTGSLKQQLHAATVNFYAVINEAYRKLDAEPISDLVLPGSNAGGGYIASIEQAKTKEHHFEDLGEYQISDFEIIADGANGPARRVKFTLSVSGGREVDAHGKTVEKFQTETRKNSWILFERKGGKWLVVRQNLGGLDG